MPKKRRYRSALRAEAAAGTRRAILDAARELFVQRGYEAMTMQAVADAAGVALDTVYDAVGKKPLLARLLVETAISNTDQAVPAEQRDYVRKIQAEPSARGKLAIYARAVADIQGRLAPLVRALQAAAPGHPELGALWQEIADRRARNMKLLAQNLVSTGETRGELSLERIADVLWTFTAPELHSLLVRERGWSAADLEAWLVDAWGRLLLE